MGSSNRPRFGCGSSLLALVVLLAVPGLDACGKPAKLAEVTNAPAAGVSIVASLEMRAGTRSASTIDVAQPSTGGRYELWIACNGSGQVAIGGQAGKSPLASLVQCPVDGRSPYQTPIPESTADLGGYHLTAVASGKEMDWWVLLVKRES